MIAIGSCDEVRVQLDFCKDLGYISESEYSELYDEYDEIGKILNRLRLKWQTFHSG